VATCIADDKFTSQPLTIALQVSLFSSTVGSFIIEIYRTLLPGSNGQNAADTPPSGAVRINIVLFLSFFLSVMSAVGCALIQQWCDQYKKFAYPRAPPHTRGRVRTYLLRGFEAFQMRRFMNGIHALLHISVFLFFWAISDFFYTVNHHFGNVTRYALVGSLIIYMLLSISPLIFSNSPYYTPMTPLLCAAFIILRILVRFPWWFRQWFRRQPFHLIGIPYIQGIHLDRDRLYAIEAANRAKDLEPYAMKWLFTDNDFSDSDMDKFLDGLPGYVSSSHTKRDQLDEYLTAEHIKSRIKQHFMTCATSVELSDQARIARVSSCVNALVLIFQHSRERKGGSSEPDKLKLKEEMQLQQEYIQWLIDDFQSLCRMDDHTIALRASCISAHAVQGLLSHLVPPNGGTTDTSQFPASLIPIYNYLFPNNNTTPSAMWMSLLHDGPLANLTRLAQAIRDREHVPPSILSFCWKILDILLTQLGTIHSDELTRAQSDFDNLHEDTRTYVHGEMGIRITPLLKILDTVARGRRLLLVFSSRPKYHSRATVVFRKEYLQNSDLLEAFAHCLPDFIANNSPNVCMDLMEKVVYRDDLWSNLQMILWITQRSTSSTSDKFRVFECCCRVLDVALSVPEDSRKVDWLAPEFGSLWQHFETFIIYSSQGAFMGRAVSFRIGIIRARFCKVLLAQFWDDIMRRNVLSFRSQWDVASLAKLIYYLGLRDEDDPEFWNSYFNGGHIGAELTVKALKVVNIIANDGPLSIFCQLGHLATSTIPSHDSDLEHKDIEKVLKLQDKLMADPRLPLNQLNGASDKVWNDLDQLQKQVEDLCSAISGGTVDTGHADDRDNAGEEVELLQPLLQKIGNVRNLRVTRSKGPSHNGHAEKRPSTVPQTTETIEGESGFERATSLSIPRASINLQPDSHPLSSSQSTVQNTIHVGTIGTSPIVRLREPIASASPASGQNAQSVTSESRRNALVALANPIISLLPRESVTKVN
jgi:hypothetical protein